YIVLEADSPLSHQDQLIMALSVARANGMRGTDWAQTSYKRLLDKNSMEMVKKISVLIQIDRVQHKTDIHLYMNSLHEIPRFRIATKDDTEAEQGTESHDTHQETEESKRQCERPRYHSLETINVQAGSQIPTTHRGSEEIAQVSSGAGERAGIVRSEKSGTSCETQRSFRNRAPEKIRQSSKKTRLEDYE